MHEAAPEARASDDDEDKDTHYPRPSRPENALLINSSWSACELGQFKRNTDDTDSTDDHRRALCADKDWMALVGDYDLGSRVAVWRWHGSVQHCLPVSPNSSPHKPDGACRTECNKIRTEPGAFVSHARSTTKSLGHQLGALSASTAPCLPFCFQTLSVRPHGSSPRPLLS